MSDQVPSDPKFTEQTVPLNAPIPQIYMNGFEVSLSLSDFSITLMAHDRQLAYLLMSFSTAKTLSESLTQAVQTLEKTTSREIMTMNDVRQAIDSKRESPAS